jgi:hypothetical protein
LGSFDDLGATAVLVRTLAPSLLLLLVVVVVEEKGRRAQQQDPGTSYVRYPPKVHILQMACFLKTGRV